MLAFTVNHTPYLQLGNAPLDGYNGGADQAEVIWQTTGAQDTDSFTAEFRQTGQVGWTSAALNTPIITGVSTRINHSATFSGLAFNADYDYRITHLRDGSPIATYESTFRTRLDAGDDTPFTFAAYGDSAANVTDPVDFRAVQARINVVDPAFSLLLGDNAYDSGTHAEFDRRLDPSVNPELTTYNKNHVDYYGNGNHDNATSSGQPSHDNYSVPIPVAGVTGPVGLAFDADVQAEENYSFDYGSVHFVTFDTNNWQNSAALDKQLDWVVADIAAARAAGNARWVVVYGHNPIVSLGGHTEQTPDDYYYDQVVSRLGAGPGGAGVDLLLEAHAHNYQRSYPLTGHTGATATYVVDTDSAYAKGAGLVQVVQGTGGQSLGYGANDATFANSPVARGIDSSTTPTAVQFGFGRIDVTPNQLTYSYVNTAGQVLDSFTITGGPDITPPTAAVSVPLDNGPADQDPGTGQVAIATPQGSFQVQLNDIGDGIDDATVVSAAVSLTKNGQPLVAGVNYTFGFDAPSDRITLTPMGGNFASGDYAITLNSGGQIKDLAANTLAQTTLTIDIDPTLPNVINFQQGADGYTGTLDTYLHEDAPDTNQGTNVKVVSDGDDDLGTSETPPQRVEGLIRFDHLFDTAAGARGQGPIPDGSVITSAILTVRTGTVANDQSGAGNIFSLHRMIADWTEAATWNSMDAGASLDGVEAASAATASVNGPSVQGATVSFDVTADVQLWSNNNTLDTRGWVIYPTTGTDGWRFDSSNAAAAANRPILTITYASPPDTVAPRVAKVQVGSDSWSTSFRDDLVANNLGTADGYAVPTGADQLKPLPWTGLNQMSIAFTEDVEVAIGDLQATGVNVPTYAANAFTYNPLTYTATWTFSTPFGADNLTLNLSDTVTDVVGNALDGEWTNQVSTGQSGDGTAGGDFSFRVNVLPADVNQDGIVDISDVQAVAARWLQSSTIVDANGSGLVDVSEIQAIAAHWLSTGGGAGGAAATSGPGARPFAARPAEPALSSPALQRPLWHDLAIADLADSSSRDHRRDDVLAAVAAGILRAGPARRRLASA